MQHFYSKFTEGQWIINNRSTVNFEVIPKFWQSYGPGLLRFRLMQVSELHWLFCVINFTFPQGIISDTYSQLLTIGYDYLVPANKHDSD